MYRQNNNSSLQHDGAQMFSSGLLPTTDPNCLYSMDRNYVSSSRGANNRVSGNRGHNSGPACLLTSKYDEDTRYNSQRRTQLRLVDASSTDWPMEQPATTAMDFTYDIGRPAPNCAQHWPMAFGVVDSKSAFARNPQTFADYSPHIMSGLHLQSTYPKNIQKSGNPRVANIRGAQQRAASFGGPLTLARKRGWTPPLSLEELQQRAAVAVRAAKPLDATCPPRNRDSYQTSPSSACFYRLFEVFLSPSSSAALGVGTNPVAVIGAVVSYFDGECLLKFEQLSDLCKNTVLYSMSWAWFHVAQRESHCSIDYTVDSRVTKLRWLAARGALLTLLNSPHQVGTAKQRILAISTDADSPTVRDIGTQALAEAWAK